MSLREVKKALDAIGAEPKRTVKEELIEQAMDIEWFEEVVAYAYNPYKQYKTTNVEYLKKADSDLLSTEGIFRQLDLMNEARGVNHRDLRKLYLLASIDQETVDVIRHIVKKDLRCGVGLKTWRKFYPSLPKHEPMLCGNDVDKFMKLAKKLSNICWSLKLDGVRCWAVVEHGQVTYLSRNGKAYLNFDCFDETLIKAAKSVDKERVVFDGEVISSDDKFDSVMSQLRKHKGVDSSIFEFHIFDIVDDKDFMWRYDMLRQMDRIFFAGSQIRVLEHEFAHPSNPKTLADYAEMTEEIVAAGGEGIVLKTADGPYEMKRSNHWCKLKVFDTVDLNVVGYEEGEGRLEGVVGKLYVAHKGVMVGVGSGFSDKQRKEFLIDLPEMIEVRYQDVTKDGSLRFPTFVRVREDK